MVVRVFAGDKESFTFVEFLNLRRQLPQVIKKKTNPTTDLVKRIDWPLLTSGKNIGQIRGRFDQPIGSFRDAPIRLPRMAMPKNIAARIRVENKSAGVRMAAAITEMAAAIHQPVKGRFRRKAIAVKTTSRAIAESSRNPSVKGRVDRFITLPVKPRIGLGPSGKMRSTIEEFFCFLD